MRRAWRLSEVPVPLWHGVASTLSRLVRHILCSPAHTAAAAASKKRISPQPAELCHTAVARKLTPKTEKKEKKKRKVKCPAYLVSEIDSLQLPKSPLVCFLSNHDLRVLKWNRRGCRALTKRPPAKRPVPLSACVYKEVKVNLHYSPQVIKKSGSKDGIYAKYERAVSCRMSASDAQACVFT